MLIALFVSQLLPYPYIEACATKPNMACEREITVQGVADMHRVISETIQTRDNEDPDDPWVPFPRDANGKIYGDCDDQAATERAALISFGMPADKLRFEIGKVKEPDGRLVGHIVLVAEIEGKEYVLDRRKPDGLYFANGPRPNWSLSAVESRASMVWPAD